MAHQLNATKFSTQVGDVPRIAPEELEKFKTKHIVNTYIEDHDSEEAKKRTESNEKIAESQFKRWAWAVGHQWAYINTLRAQNFSDDSIQAMCDGVRPLCFTSPELHSEFCKSLAELAKALEHELGWKNVRFVQTGSSVVGFSTNPLKGLPHKPTKITSVESSDVDVVIVAEGLHDWLTKSAEQGKTFLGRNYPTTRTRHTFGKRASCKKPEEVCEPLNHWYSTWSKKFGGGLQVTFDTEEQPVIPPWESWIPIH